MFDPGALGTLLIGLRSLEDADESSTRRRQARARAEVALATEASQRRTFSLRAALRRAFRQSPKERTVGSRP